MKPGDTGGKSCFRPGKILTVHSVQLIRTVMPAVASGTLRRSKICQIMLSAGPRVLFLALVLTLCLIFSRASMHRWGVRPLWAGLSDLPPMFLLPSLQCAGGG